MAKKPRTLRQAAIQELEKQCFPMFLENGFTLCPSRSVMIGGNPERHYPLGTLERQNSDGSIDMVEIEFNRHGSPSYRICFAQIAKEGGYSDYSFHTLSEAVPAGVGTYGHCSPSRLFNFFYYTILFSKRAGSGSVQKLISKSYKACEQVLNWFDTGRVGSTLCIVQAFPKGAKIYYGFRRWFFFRVVDVSFMSPYDRKPYFHTYDDVEKFLDEELDKQNRHVRFGIYYPWQKIFTR